MYCTHMHIKKCLTLQLFIVLAAFQNINRELKVGLYEPAVLYNTASLRIILQTVPSSFATSCEVAAGAIPTCSCWRVVWGRRRERVGCTWQTLSLYSRSLSPHTLQEEKERLHRSYADPCTPCKILELSALLSLIPRPPLSFPSPELPQKAGWGSAFLTRYVVRKEHCMLGTL